MLLPADPRPLRRLLWGSSRHHPHVAARMGPRDGRGTIPAYHSRGDRAAILRWSLTSSPQMVLPVDSKGAEIAGRIRHGAAPGRLAYRQTPIRPPPAPESIRGNCGDLEILST